MPQSSSPHRAHDSRRATRSSPSQRQRRSAGGPVVPARAGTRAPGEGGRLRAQAPRRAAAGGARVPEHRTSSGCPISDFRRCIPSSTQKTGSSASERFFRQRARWRRCGTRAAGWSPLESQTLVREFDIFAFSVSFEWDYTNVLTLLRLAGIPLRAADRTPHDPIVMIGGAVTFVNPEPLALFADIIAAGEGEALIPPLLAAFQNASDRDDMLRRLVAERGFYVPAFYDVKYPDDGTIDAFVVEGRDAGAARCAEGRASHDRGSGPSRHEDLHAGDRVRVEVPGRSRPRLREPLPVLLGGIQLPARARVSEGSHPRARQTSAPAIPIAPASSRLRCAITRRSKPS